MSAMPPVPVVLSRRPVLSPVLRQRTRSRQAATSHAPGTLWPLAALLLLMSFTVSKAQAGPDAWPLLLLWAVPILALVAGTLSGLRRPAPVKPTRSCRIVRERRPVLLRTVIRVPAGRSARIVGRVVHPAELALPRPIEPAGRRPARLIRPCLPA